MARRWKKNPYGGRERGIFSKPTRAMRELVEHLWLDSGSHTSATAGVCVMECLAYITRQKHSDHPVCTSQVITDRCISVNDAWEDEPRQRLKEVLLELVGTRPTRLVRQDREVFNKTTGLKQTFSFLVEEPDSTPEYLDAEVKRRRILENIDTNDVDGTITLLLEACHVSADGERIEPDENENPVIVHETTEAITSIEFEEIPLDPEGIAAAGRREVESK